MFYGVVGMFKPVISGASLRGDTSRKGMHPTADMRIIKLSE